MIVAVAAALALGACGSSGDNNGASASSRQDKAFEGALKFAKCMRDHGIDVPDPQRTGSGGIRQTINGKPGSRAAMEAAQKDCQKYMQIGGGKAPSAAEQAKVKDSMLAYAKCMRDNGVDMPDPKFSNGGATFSLGSGSTGGRTGGPNPDSPAFKKADQACHSKLAGLGKGGSIQDGGPSTSSGGEDGKG